MTLGANLAGVELSHAMPLLADRLTLGMPASAFQDPPIRHQGGLMGFDRLCPRDHRAGFDLPGGKLRVVAEELFCLNDGKVSEHLLQRAARSSAEWRTQVQVQEIAPRRHWLLLPAAPPPVAQGSAHLLATSYFMHDDRTLLMVHYYLSPEAVADLGAARAFVVRQATTLRAGPRAYPRGPCRVALIAPGEAPPGLSLQLAADFIPTLDRGPDYLVHRLLRLEALSSVAGPELMIYLGHHPSYHGPGRGIPRAEVILPIFGADASWRAYLEFRDNEPVGRVYETIVPAPHPDRFACHVRAAFPAPEQESALLGMIASLSVG